MVGPVPSLTRQNGDDVARIYPAPQPPALFILSHQFHPIDKNATAALRGNDAVQPSRLGPVLTRLCGCGHARPLEEEHDASFGDSRVLSVLILDRVAEAPAPGRHAGVERDADIAE